MYSVIDSYVIFLRFIVYFNLFAHGISAIALDFNSYFSIFTDFVDVFVSKGKEESNQTFMYNWDIELDMYYTAACPKS
jgi:hypothetical protein